MSRAPDRPAETDRPTDPQSPSELDRQWDALLRGEPLPMIARSLAAFRRDLPELLKTHYYQWVAYHGDERIGFGATETELYQECFRRGLTRDDFVVCSIEPREADPDQEFEASLDV